MPATGRRKFATTVAEKEVSDWRLGPTARPSEYKESPEGAVEVPHKIMVYESLAIQER